MPPSQAKLRKGAEAKDTTDAKSMLRAGAQLLEERKELAKSLVAEGLKVMAPLLERVKDKGATNPDKALFQKPLDMFQMALDLDEENGMEAREALGEMMSVFETDEEAMRPPPNHPHEYDVIIVGAGASGVGMGLMLTRVFNLDPKRVLIVERGAAVGESFRRWPQEMRFISPSFNNQGWTYSFDLNAVAFHTSPAFTLQSEHPNGAEYAHYLETLAKNNELNIQFRTQVSAITPIRSGGFKVDVAPAKPDGAAGWALDDAATKTLKAQYCVWAAGEFQYPNSPASAFPGAELCMHNSSVRSWADLPGDDFVVIGGYESGMDALYNLTMCGKKCTVASSTAFWKVATDDPSTELAPYTMERVRTAFRFAKASPTLTPPRLLAPLRVAEVAQEAGGGFVVRATWGAPVKHEGGEHRSKFHGGDASLEETGEEGVEIELRTPQAPILATGFAGSCAAGVAKDLFEWGEKGSGCLAGSPLLSDEDESTKTPGLFLVGPAVRHEDHVFCFVYKFRQRFGVVADAIAQGLGHETEDTVHQCREFNMYLDDFECCKGACGETC